MVMLDYGCVIDVFQNKMKILQMYPVVEVEVGFDNGVVSTNLETI